MTTTGPAGWRFGGAATAGAVLLAGGAGALHWLTAGTLTAALHGPASFENLLAVLVAGLAWACFGWLGLGVALGWLAVLPGVVGAGCDRVARRVTPALVRRAVRVALGVTVVTGPVAAGALPAAAASPAPSGVTVGRQLPDQVRPALPGLAGTGAPGRPLPDSAVPAGRWAPDPGSPTAAELPGLDRPGVHAPPAPPGTRILGGPTREVEGGEYVVTAGDTLWGIAAAHLPAGATAGQIDREWRRWYAANRAAVGTDPNLIYAGQVLHPPTEQPDRPDQH